MAEALNHIPAMPLRPPGEVMRLRRMGAAFPSRLSFMRVLLRRLGAERAVVTRPVWEIDAQGFGHAVYSVPLGGHVYSLVAVANDLPQEARTDRVIATAWDAAFVLFDGVPDSKEIARICEQAPLQEAGRFCERDLVLSRANKSVRLFSHVIERLSQGQQPDAEAIRQTGYLMRTTAVYGNGKFGIADRAAVEGRPGLAGSFMAEMLTVWLIRGFTHDLVEHLGGAEIDADLKRHLGIGNSTGLGMAPFLVSHPELLHRWAVARETALARVRGIEFLSPDHVAALYDLMARGAAHLAEWQVADEIASARIATLRREWPMVAECMDPDLMTGPFPLEALWQRAAKFSPDTQEMLATLLIEPFGDLVDDLAASYDAGPLPRVDPAQDVQDLRQHIEADWAWALAIDFDAPENEAVFWYVSEAKAEPRLGLRHEEPGSDRESPLDIARQVAGLARDLAEFEGSLPEFVQQHPEHRGAICRVQGLARFSYGEIRDNLIGEGCLPIDMLRFKLACFGAAKFDPKSDRWTRIALGQGAPLFDELGKPDQWWMASLT